MVGFLTTSDSIKGKHTDCSSTQTLFSLLVLAGRSNSIQHFPTVPRLAKEDPTSSFLLADTGDKVFPGQWLCSPVWGCAETTATRERASWIDLFKRQHVTQLYPLSPDFSNSPTKRLEILLWNKRNCETKHLLFNVSYFSNSKIEFFHQIWAQLLNCGFMHLNTF